jgi:hypothetical protein
LAMSAIAVLRINSSVRAPSDPVVLLNYRFSPWYRY